jgi:hypothetical protein
MYSRVRVLLFCGIGRIVVTTVGNSFIRVVRLLLRLLLRFLVLSLPPHQEPYKAGT